MTEDSIQKPTVDTSIQKLNPKNWRAALIPVSNTTACSEPGSISNEKKKTFKKSPAIIAIDKIVYVFVFGGFYTGTKKIRKFHPTQKSFQYDIANDTWSSIAVLKKQFFAANFLHQISKDEILLRGW